MSTKTWYNFTVIFYIVIKHFESDTVTPKNLNLARRRNQAMNLNCTERNLNQTNTLRYIF